MDKVKIEKQPIPENIFNFLAEKTYNKFDDRTKEFLLITSVIENFHAELCLKSLGIDNFEKIIAKLLENHTFVLTIPFKYGDGTSIVSYNYLILFRNYMQSKLFELKSAEEIKEIYRKTYIYYNGKNDVATSINYMIKAEDFEEAAEKINDNFKEMFKEGKIEFLWSWLNALPSKYIDNNINSLINLGILQKFYAGNLKTSMEYLDKALVKAKEVGDNRLLVHASINRALVMQNIGNTASVIIELRALFGDPSLKEFKNNLAYYLAYALFQSSEYQKAEELLGEIENKNYSPVDAGLLNSSRKLLGHINLIRGNYIKAVDFYEKAVNDERNVIDRFEVLCNLALLSSQSAEYSKAEKYLTELEELIIRFPTTILKIPYLLARQSFLFESGDYDGAIEVLKNIYEESVSLNHKQYIYLSSRLITECFYYKREIEQAKSYFVISKELLDVNNHLKSMEVEVFRALLFDISPDEKESIFLKAYNYYTDTSLFYNLAQIGYYISDFYFKIGSKEKIRNYLRLTLETSRLNGYNSFLIREYRNDNQLLNFALENPGEENDYDRNYLIELKQKAK